MPDGDFFYWASAKFLSSALTTIGLGESGYYLKVRIRYEFFKRRDSEFGRPCKNDFGFFFVFGQFEAV